MNAGVEYKADSGVVGHADGAIVDQKSPTIDAIEDLYESMKKMNTDDEGTKRFLLALNYINRHCSGREVMLNGQSGDIIFGKIF